MPQFVTLAYFPSLIQEPGGIVVKKQTPLFQVEQVFAERDIMLFTDNPFVVSMFCMIEMKKLKNMGLFLLDMARMSLATNLYE